MTEAISNRLPEYRIDQLPNELVDKVLSYIPGGDPGLASIAAISTRATEALAEERPYYCDESHSHPEHVLAHLNQGRFCLETFTVPLPAGVDLKLHREVVRHPTDAHKLQIVFSDDNNFDLSKTLEVDLQKVTLTPTSNTSSLRPIDISSLFSASHSLGKLFYFPRSPAPPICYIYNSTAIGFAFSQVNIINVEGRSLKVNGTHIKDFTVMPQGYIAVQTDLSLQIYNIHNLHLAAEYPCHLGERFAFTADDKKLVGIEVVNNTEVKFRIIDFNKKPPLKSYKKITIIQKATFLIKQLAQSFFAPILHVFPVIGSMVKDGCKIILIGIASAGLIALGLLIIKTAIPILVYLGMILSFAGLGMLSSCIGALTVCAVAIATITLIATIGGIFASCHFAWKNKVF